LIPLGRVAEIQLGKMLQPEPATASDLRVPYLRAGSLARLHDLEDLPEMYASEADIRKYTVTAGDLVVAEGGDCGQSAFLPPVPSPTIIQNSLHRVRTTSADIRFVHYSLTAIHGTKWLDVFCNKSTFGHLTREKLGELPIPCSPPRAQRAIADYLDRETASLDAVVDAKQKMIQVTEDRLQLLAHQLTSRGDDRVPLRRLVESVKTGATPPADELMELQDGELPWYSPIDFTGWLRLGKPVRSLQARAGDEGVVPMFPARSVLVVGIGATAGKVALLGEAGSGNQQVTCLVAGPRVEARFLAWQLLARQDELRATAPFTTLPILNNDFIRSLPISLPSISEQMSAADRLDQEAAKMLAVREREEKQIALLQERRQALITAAVTDLLDVPEAA
jgi:type I restriction enzyme S subunit